MAEKTIDFSILDKFNFKTAPVGIKFTVKRLEGVPRITQKMTLCQMLKYAQDGNAFYPELEDHTCDAGLYVMGMKDVEPQYINGEYGTGLQVYESPRAGSRLYHHIYKINRGTVNYVSLAPLKKMNFDPDVLLITADTTQAEILLRASSYRTGEPWVSRYTAALGCDWLLVYPYVSGQMNHTTTGLGFGMRRRRIFPEGQHFIAIPFDKMRTMLDTLAVMPWVPEPYKENGMEYVKNLRIGLGLDQPA